MSSYTLSNNAADIDAAISSVVGADAIPTDGSQNMVTSGGVKTYVDGTVGVFGGKTITTEATGIENTDNDTSIPTSAAVKDYADQFGPAYVDFSFPLPQNTDIYITGSNQTLITGTIPVAGYYTRFGTIQVMRWSYDNNYPYTYTTDVLVNGSIIDTTTATVTYRNWTSTFSPPSNIYLPAGNLLVRIRSSSSSTFRWQNTREAYEGPTTRYVKVG